MTKFPNRSFRFFEFMAIRSFSLLSKILTERQNSYCSKKSSENFIQEGYSKFHYKFKLVEKKMEKKKMKDLPGNNR